MVEGVLRTFPPYPSPGYRAFWHTLMSSNAP